jgi:hypothetical protein
MGNLIFDIDPEEIAQIVSKATKEVEQDIKKSAENLAAMTHAKAHELARDELKSLAQQYSDNLEFSNPEENLWVITLKDPAAWIEDGRKSGFMEELLNGKSSKTNKKGEKYAVIPFEHSKQPSQQSTKAQALSNEIKQVMKEKNISWKNLELGPNGSPRVGRLHSFNVETAKASDKHKFPLTHGVSVYQTKDKNTGKVRRDVMTFRIITEKHKEEGKWIHPGREGAKILDKAFEWAMKEWETNILPAIFEKHNG